MTLDYFPVLLRGLRINENTVNENMYCRTETLNSNTLLHGDLFRRPT